MACCNCIQSTCCCPERQLPATLHATLIPIDTSACCNVGMVTFPLVFTTAWNAPLGWPYPYTCWDTGNGTGPPQKGGAWYGEYTTANPCLTGGTTCTAGIDCSTGATGGVATPCTFRLLWSPGTCCFNADADFSARCCVPFDGPPPGECLQNQTRGAQMTGPNAFPGLFFQGFTSCPGGNFNYSLGVVCANGTGASDCYAQLPLEYATYNNGRAGACYVLWTAGWTPALGVDYSDTATYKCRTRLIVSL